MTVPADVTDAFIALRDAVVAVQPNYQFEQGMYWQGGATNGDASVKAPDVAQSWADLGLSPPAGQTVSVSEYVGPEGEGFVVNSTYVDATNVTWMRSDQTGPETYRNSGGWQSQSDDTSDG